MAGGEQGDGGGYSFIPLAEETGLIVELGEWVARSCCRQQAAWQAEGLDCVPLAINMSPLQLQREELPSRIESLLTEHGVPADVIEIEITETVLLKSLEATVIMLRRLEALGVQISLDDFGSGFSSLSYVQTAHNLGMQVIAEGVETLEQLIYLKTAGCDQAQGYYFSRPVPAASARDLLRNGVLAPS